MTKLAYNYAEAAAATGYSETVIRRAVNAGHLAVVTPLSPNGKTKGAKLSKPVILADELDRWLRAS